MKKRLLIAAALVLLALAAIPLATRILGPRIISVPSPSGQPIGEHDLPRPEESILAVDIALPLDALESLANERAPERFRGSERKNFHERISNGAYAWEVRRGPIAFENEGGKLGFATPIEGAARFEGQLDAEIITLPIDSTVQIAGAAGGTLSPVVTPEWRIDPRFAPAMDISRATLSIGGFGRMDISDLLGGALGDFVQREAGELAPVLRESIDLRREIDELWRQGYVTETISDDPPVWLSITPQEVMLAPIDYSDPEQITLTAAIRSETYLTNRQPGAPEPAPLPDMKPLDGPVATELRLPLVVGMTELNEVLAEETFEIETGFGAEVAVSGAQAEVGRDGQLNLRLAIEADQGWVGRGVTGEIWLRGRPVIDYEEQTLAFTDVTFTVETRDTLTRAAAWLLEELLIKGIERELRVDLDDYDAEIDEEVQKAIREAELPEGIEVSVENLDIRLADIYTVTRHFPEGAGEAEAGIVVVIRATGEMGTRITRLRLDPEDSP